LLGLCIVTGASALEVPYDYLVPCTPENAIFGHFSATKKPVVSVKSGAVVKIEGGGGIGGGMGRGGRAVGAPAPTSEEEAAARTKFYADNNIALTADNPIVLEIARAQKESPNKLPPPPGAPPGTGVGGHFIIGPVYVEDAEPGDSLEVRILDVTPRVPFGSTGSSPGRGGLALGTAIGVVPTPAGSPTDTPAPVATPAIATMDAPRASSKITILDLKRNAGVFSKDIEVPLGPFMGVMATCPPDSEGPNRRSTKPGTFGGNLDCKELVAGSTLYLPVYQKGALFYTGDSHAAQGDGEVTGTAIETADACTLQFILHKGKMLKMPRAETPTDYIVFGLDADLNKAMRQAVEEAVNFLEEKQGFDIFQAYSLSSIAVNFRVTQVVDQTLGIHGMIPKRIFVNDRDSYWYRSR
jgi:acetamidase/formamidase